jgi:hypothetical protein
MLEFLFSMSQTCFLSRKNMMLEQRIGAFTLFFFVNGTNLSNCPKIMSER